MEEHQDEKRVNEDERIAESVSDMLFDDGAATEAEAMPDAPAGDDAPEFVAEGEGHGAAVPEGAYPQAPLQYDGEADAEAPDDAPYIAPVEAFVPTDAFQTDVPRVARKRKKRRKKRSWPWILLIVLGVLVAVGGIFVYRLRYNPASFFTAQSAATPAPESTPAPTEAPVQAEAVVTPEPSPTPTLNPYQQLEANADAGMMQGIVNVLVIGVDYAEERETWNGKKEWHSDVMMVLAINFKENRVDLISLPRDTYANIPGVKGIYKLNASINCGGGMDAPNGAGFLKVCEAASWMLGGIPVDYYYAVTMPAVKQLVDTVGGVEYDLEMSYTMMGRSYRKGQQHLDGQGVLDYLRVRKNIAQAGDVNRVNRQKRMMVALFETMQQQNLIVKIPDIIASFEGQLFTNCSTGQTAALATFAYNLNKENIGMYSMTSKGGGNTNIFNWNFCLTDQPNRVAIIKSIYGIDVPEEKEYTPSYAKYRWAAMRTERYLANADKILSFASGVIASGELILGGEGVTGPAMPETPVPDGAFGDGTTNGVPDGGAVSNRQQTGFTVTRLALQPSHPATLRQQYTEDGLAAYNSLRAAANDLQDARVRADKQAEKYLNGEENSFSGASASLVNALDRVKSLGESVAFSFGYSGSLGWSVRYEKDTSFNEVTVDFN